MYTTLEVIVEPNGQVRILEPLILKKPAHALLTILEEGPKTANNAGVPSEGIGTGFSLLIASLTEFPDDFMSEGRAQPPMSEREEFV